MSPQASRTVQAYLKAIHDAGGTDQRVKTMAIAQRLRLRPTSVTEMLWRLKAAGWIDFESRRGAQLREEGAAEVRRLIRRQQLIECLLVRVLGFDLAEVHAEAEALGYVMSPRLTQVLAEYLGEPTEGLLGQVIPADGGSCSREPASEPANRC